MESCSPSRRRAGGSSRPKVKSCFSYQSLAKIARRFNEANPQNPITISRNRDELWRAIKRRIPQCSDERCWTHSVGLSNSERDKVLEDFKPPIPRGKNVWLTTQDIDRVMIQYEKVFPSFAWLGTLPIDFQDVDPERVADLKRWLRSSRVSTIGMVLNLDRHNQPGSHWVAVLIDPDRKVMEYFDSFADKAPDRVRRLFQEIVARGDKKWRFRENAVVHQLKNSECGVYAINFLVKRLNGDSFSRVVKDIIRDDEMNRKRKHYFDPNNSYNSI